MSFKVFNSILGRLHGNFQQYYPFSCVAPIFLAPISKSIALKHRKLLLNIKYMLRVKYICYYNMNSSLIMPIWTQLGNSLTHTDEYDETASWKNAYRKENGNE